MSEGKVGFLTWECCDRCKHYRPDVGGCDPLDEYGHVIIDAGLGLNEVICTEFAATPEEED